jgi:glycosyltransferase involved in cell wall biosynthesis
MASVSVIMPVYNVARYLHAAVESVIAQTMSDWELILVNDGSTDNSLTIAREYAAREPRIRVEAKPNGGISSARNQALRLATGEFLAILDSDDAWDPSFLETQVGILRTRAEIDIVTGNALDLGGRFTGRPTRPFPDHRPQPDLAQIIGDAEAIFIMCVMRRHVYDVVGPFDESLRTNEDYDYWLRAAVAGFRFHRNDRPLGHYRRRGDSLSADDLQMLRGILRVYEKTRPLVEDRPRERAILDRQVEYFEGERLAAEARRAMTEGNARAAGERLLDLYARGGGALVGVAGFAAKHTPQIAMQTYRMRRTARDSMIKRVVGAARSLDHGLGRLWGRRTVLIEARTPMNLAVLRPVFEPLLEDPRLTVRFTSQPRDDMRRAFEALNIDGFVVSRARAQWLRNDLYINADPWDAVTLRRGLRALNFFHGVAGKYNLDRPSHLPLSFDRYDRVAFPNERRLESYVEAGIVARDRAVLVGFPKTDALVNEQGDPRQRAAALGLDPSRPTVIYAPTFSAASSLGLAGEAIVRALLGADVNVIAKLHDRSLDPDPKYHHGVDWHARLRDAFGSRREFLFAAGGDSTPYVLASEVMVTDHSSVGFEFCALDRPLILFDAPALLKTARINPEKAALLRSAAVVVSDPSALPGAVREALGAPAMRAAERRRAAADVFFAPGSATGRALGLVYELLELSPSPRALATRTPGAWERA